MNRTFDVKAFFKTALRLLWVVVLCAAVGFAGMYFLYEYDKVPYYTASATMYISNISSSVSSQQSVVYSSDLYSASRLVETYTILLRSNKIVDVAAEKLNGKYSASYISSCLSVSSINGTEIMSIQATTSDPESSVEICNAVAEIAPDALRTVVKAGAAELIDAATITNTYRSNPRSYSGPMLGATVGAVVAVGIIFLVFMLDNKIKSKEEIQKTYGLTVLGEIPNFASGRGHYGKGHYGKYSQYSKYGEYSSRASAAGSAKDAGSGK